MKNILLFTLLLCSMTLHAQTYRVYPVPQKITMNGNTIKMTPNVNIVKETGINEITNKPLPAKRCLCRSKQ